MLMKVHLKALSILFLLILLGPHLLWAEDERSKNIQDPPPKTELQKTLLKDHNTISTLFDKAADSIDRFLTGQRFSQEQNQTRVTIENTNVLMEGQRINTVNNIGVNLRLPNFEKYWQLKFTNYDQQTSDRGVRGSYLKQNQSEKNYGATVGVFREIDSLRFSFRPRILLEDPLNISHSMAVDTTLKNNYLEFKPKLELFANPEKGTGVFGSFNNSLFLNEIFTLNIINEGEYQEKFHLFTTTQGLSLAQIIDDKSYLSYNLFFVAINRPDYQLDNFNISPAYNCTLYKDILDMQFSPGINFSKESRWHGISYVSISFFLYF